MSTVAQKKAACGYEDKPVNRMCSNCVHFALDRVLTLWMEQSNAERMSKPEQWRPKPYTVGQHGVEKNLRCTRNGIPVKKTARCATWEAKSEGGAA